MGMTIDDAIQNIEIVKEDYWEDDGYGNETKEYQDTMLSFDILIDTAKKYQKIEQIVKQYKKFGNIDFSMQIISGVVEDGKID